MNVDFETFYRTVWEIVRQVPPGQVTTYGQIASMIPCPPGVPEEAYRKLAPRWVGDAMNQVSAGDDITIPGSASSIARAR
ncbi:MAG: MGMT family protein [Anaerolineae bacterium]|nr:MGMT family protein [Anaerolineae bacterium]